MRFIDADKVIDVMKAAYWDENIHSAKDDPCVIDAMIDWSIRQVKDAPTEDAAPVVHAHWIEKEYVELKDTGVYAMLGTCSNCNCEVITDESAEYCSNCSAVMDEEEPHEMCFDFEKAFHGALMDEEVDDE